jgi:two-component system CheB/CheR fusion protein
MQPEELQFESLLFFVQQQCGFDFTGYKRPGLIRRMTRRMQRLGLERFGDYADYLEAHREEFGRLFDSILINVTSFFRDAEAWKYVENEVIPAMLASKGPADTVRVWSAGCASGEEAYTIAMLLAEAMGADAFRRRAKVYATDVDEDALNQARQAVYTAKDLEPVPPALRERYFEPSSGRFVFRSDLRREIIFRRHDLAQEAPIPHLDLLVSRNALMYFNAETQQRIVSRFHFALNGDGYLFLGRAEMLLAHANLFTPLDLKCRVFAKVPEPGQRGRTDGPDKPGAFLGSVLAGLRGAAVVVDANLDVLMWNHRAEDLWGLRSDEVQGKCLLTLGIGLAAHELRNVMRPCLNGEAEFEEVTVDAVNRRGKSIRCRISVAPLVTATKKRAGMLLLMDEVAGP